MCYVPAARVRLGASNASALNVLGRFNETLFHALHYCDVRCCWRRGSFAGRWHQPQRPHYSLNIIGVENPKTDAMTGGDRHTIFVGLGAKNSAVTSRIYLTPGPFAVCDGTPSVRPTPATDRRRATGRGVQLPCDTAVPTDTGCSEGTFSAPYQIWARALGTLAAPRP